ncbi:DUF4238 domain-containing protein [Burkholderia gladioli]|uniref:DUF4238 domain-containing protein n=1 Tax=Burkholderia gladioli TaxID=28095 RepID=UPI00163F499D|nr:DUF4238 domain-containing protein [Burkholderia gladioli]
MSTHNEHHYIPKFLLERWHSGDDKKLSHMRWNRGEITEKRYKAKSVAKERHLYSMKRLSAQPNQEIEPKFMTRHIDDPASLIHKALLTSRLQDLPEEQKYTWTLFLVSLLYRGPGAIEHVRECGIDALRSQFPEDEYTAVELTDSSNTLLNLYRRRDVSLLDFGTYALPELIQTSSYNKLFFEADWGIRKMTKTKEMLLIGDRPLTLFGPTTRLDLTYLPLAPDVAFFVSKSARMTRWVNSMSDLQLVRQLNRSMVEQASQYVWGSNFEHRRLLERRLHRTAAGRGIGIGPRPTL